MDQSMACIDGVPLGIVATALEVLLKFFWKANLWAANINQHHTKQKHTKIKQRMDKKNKEKKNNNNKQRNKQMFITDYILSVCVRSTLR